MTNKDDLLGSFVLIVFHDFDQMSSYFEEGGCTDQTFLGNAMDFLHAHDIFAFAFLYLDNEICFPLFVFDLWLGMPLILQVSFLSQEFLVLLLIRAGGLVCRVS